MLRGNEVPKRITNEKIKVKEEKSDFKLFKGVVRSLVRDAMEVLEETEIRWELNHEDEELREKYYLLHHYLDYLMRFCEEVGKEQERRS